MADVRQITSAQPNGEHPRLLLRLQGCLELLDRSGVQLSGKRAVVVGRSNIVGTPVAQLLQVCGLMLHTTLSIGLSVLQRCHEQPCCTAWAQFDPGDCCRGGMQQ